MILLFFGRAAADPNLPPGRYGMELWVTSATRTPVLGEIHGQSVSWLLIDIEDDGTRLWQEQRACAIELLDTFGGSRASFSPLFVSSLPTRRYPVSLTDGYRVDAGIEYIGYDPAYPLPSRGGEPGVVDWDRDGNPGATIHLKIPLLGVAEIYIAQHAQILLEGASPAAGRVSGSLSLPLFEQRTLGASTRVLDRSPPIRPILDKSGFSMAPLEADTECRTLLSDLCSTGAARAESCARLFSASR